MITANGLEKLGFVDQRYFILRNNSDGKGVFINEWFSDLSQPSEAEIDEASKVAEAEYNAQAYARSRATEYPSIQDQLDLQYWDKVNSTDKWGEAVKAVKDKYPKG